MKLASHRSFAGLCSLIFFVLFFQHCSSPVTNYTHEVIREDSLPNVVRAAEIRKNTPVELAEGLELSLWASDSLAPDPVAMSIDDYGRIYLTRTNRQKHSEFDIRGHMSWTTPSISWQSVEDRRAFLRETFAPERSDENSWLKDLNNDSIHDWKDLAVEKDEVWRLEDLNNDGLADVSTRILDDFNEEITDVAGALLVRRNDIFVGIGPDMWRITDRDGDGRLDTKESISHGYAVHIGFSGHGMSGAIEGPDGKIYWGIGDIGANITSKGGKTFKYPNQGILVRSNPDGSDFEVFARGLRNTHEFTFDEHGNIIGADNDGDHPGESERLVYIVEGSDAGWRTNWQFGKYTDPKNNSYKVWMDEKLYLPRWEGQASYIIPPIASFHNGPTGMVYNPGTALGSKWQNKFFLVEFVGSPARSPIWAFSLTPSGASFDLEKEEVAVKGILPTGIRFGPDGALYIADWVNGWRAKNYGRVWKLDVSDEFNDLKAERNRTQELIRMDYSRQTNDELYEFLFYPDMRIRQKAQFELAERGGSSMEIFQRAINQRENQLARIHSIWGIGQLTRLKNSPATSLLAWLDDPDPEVVAQTAKVLGEVRSQEAGEQLIPLLRNENDRVKFFAAQALGRIRFSPAAEPLIQMLEQNADEDVYLRHAGVLALARIGDVKSIYQLEDHPNRSLRLAAVLALRRLSDEQISRFLDDEDEYIVTEAARAINDDWSIERSLPDLAAVLQETRFSSEPLLRRAINAASRVGGTAEVDLLVRFVNREDIPVELRTEALSVLGSWANPSVLDRVDGRWRGKVSRDDSYVVSALKPFLTQYLHSADEDLIVAANQALTNLGIQEHTALQFELARTHSSPAVRATMISSLHKLAFPEIVDVVQSGMEDENEEVRTTAMGLLDELDLTAGNLPKIVNPVFEVGTLREQQQMLEVLGELPTEKTNEVLEGLVTKWIDGKLDAGISLDLIEAVDSSGSEQLIKMIAPHRPSGTSLADFQDALYGGDARAGRDIFRNHPAASCVRCHSWEENTGSVGPSLRGIANKLKREELLQALVEPSARLAPGYGSVVLTLTDGSRVSGILMEETNAELTLKTSEAEPLEVPVGRIAKRENMPSGMPPMGMLLTRREIRDLVEFLSNLKRE